VSCRSSRSDSGTVSGTNWRATSDFFIRTPESLKRLSHEMDLLLVTCTVSFRPK
jgi:hypothetical protein